MERPEGISEKRVWLDENDCERLKRSEYEAVRCLLGAVSYIASASDGLKDRVECIPYGKQRMALVLGGVRAMANDVIGTVPRGQCRQLRNTMDDFEMRMVPKMTKGSQNVILEKDIAKGLVDAAREKCRICAEDARSCRECSLYKLLESFLPLDSYEGGMLCPYSLSEWSD